METLTISAYVLLHCVTFSFAEDRPATLHFTPEKLLAGKFANETSDKLALRYGFQKSDCKNFKVTYLCMHRCIYEVQYDVAYVDRKCLCTCFLKPDKPKTINKKNRGKNIKVPGTSLPSWVGQENEQEDDLSESDIYDEHQAHSVTSSGGNGTVGPDGAGSTSSPGGEGASGNSTGAAGNGTTANGDATEGASVDPAAVTTADASASPAPP